jgi:hypothetical protein
MSIAEETIYTTEALALTGFKAADKILLSWGCTEKQCHTILGISGLSYHKFKSAPCKTSPQFTITITRGLPPVALSRNHQFQ